MRALVVTAALAVLVTGCDFAIGGGVLAGVVVAGIVSYDCSEGVGVAVWDRSTARAMCDAKVVAERGTTHVQFSPCYNAFLDEGSWTVVASKPGYVPASGTVVIPHEHRCSEPSYHSLELTLRPENERPSGYVPPVMPAYAPPVASPPGPVPSRSAAPETAPTSAPSPSGTAPPTGAFPPVAPTTR